MKILELLKNDLISKIRGYFQSVLIILVSLVFSFVVLFPVTAYLKSEMNKLNSLELDMATYKINAFPNNKIEAHASIELFQAFFLSGKYPKVEECYDLPIFRIIPYSTDMPASLWYAYFGDNTALDIPQRWKDTIVAGRWFAETSDNGITDAAILSRIDFPSAIIGDNLLLLDREVKVIAITEDRNIIPWKIIDEAQTDNQSFGLVSCSCLLSRSLTTMEQSTLTDNGVLSVKSMLELSGTKYLLSTLLMIAILGGITLIIILNIRNLFIHIFRKEAYRLSVIKLCGGNMESLLLIIYAFPTIICIAAYIISLAIHLIFVDRILCNKLLYPRITAVDYLVLFLLSIVFLFLVLLPSAKRVIKSDAADQRMWR